jgi:hypothetical protein
MHGIGAPQVYPVCFQARLSGSGTAIPTDTVKFPAAYNINDDFKTYNIYDASKDHSQFVPPGPPAYQGGVGGAAVPAPSGGNATAVAPSSSAMGTSGGIAAVAPSSARPRTSGSPPSSVPRPATSGSVSVVSSGGSGNTGAGASAPGRSVPKRVWCQYPYSQVPPPVPLVYPVKEAMIVMSRWYVSSRGDGC